MDRMGKILFVCTGVLLIFIIMAIWFSMSEQVKINQENLDIRETCLTMGFPETIKINETVFCLRQVDGTDHIIPLDWAEIHGEK